MSPRTMRILFVSVSVILVSLPMIQATDVPKPNITRKCPDPELDFTEVPISDFFRKEDHRVLLSNLIQLHFTHSLTYLFTSQQYGSQFVQRPGMAKLLKEASDKNWEEGLDILKKSLQRGGLTEYIFQPSFVASGKGQQTSETYVETLENLVKESESRFKKMKRIYRKALMDKCDGDAEIAHYFEDKMEAEAKHIREMAGFYFTLNKMKLLGVAVSTFDSNI